MDAYSRTVTAVRSRVLTIVRATWLGLDAYHDGDASRFIAAIAPVVLGGQQQIATLTHAYLSQLLPGVVASLDTAQVIGAAARNGVAPEEVYRRPFVELYTALSQGTPFDAARRLGTTRLEQLASTDLQLARTHAAQATFRGSSVRYFRRTLSGSKNCGLCVIAATQRYRTNSLMPIHPGCDCGIAPLAGTASHVVDPDLLARAHAAIALETGTHDAGGRAPDYRKLIVTHEHGEMGPLLAVRRHDFKGPADI